MEYTKPVMKCVCGKKPKLKLQAVDGTGTLKYYRYGCSECDINTFGTKSELCSRELWNATIERRVKK